MDNRAIKAELVEDPLNLCYTPQTQQQWKRVYMETPKKEEDDNNPKRARMWSTVRSPGCLASAGSSFESSIKAEAPKEEVVDQDNGKDSGSSVSGASATSPTTSAKAPQICFACNRTIGVSPSFYESDVLCEAPCSDPKSKCCKDCNNTFRTNLRKQVSMTLLKSHLEDKANKRSWDATFIAHLSLKFDGAKIVTKEMMDERLPLIEWLLKLMGLPSTPSVVVPLTEFEKNYDASLFNANVLTTIRRGGAEEIGIHVPVDFMELATSFKKPLQEGAQPNYHPFSYIASSSQGSRDALSRLCGAKLPAVPASAAQDETQLTIATDRTRLDTVLADTVRTFMKVLEVFCKHEWESKLKESMFTMPVNKLGAMLAQCQASGEVRAFDESTRHSVGMTNCKAFAKMYREFQKSGRKQGRLIDMVSQLTATVQYVRQCGYGPTASLLLFWLKALFHKSCLPDPEQEKSPYLIGTACNTLCMNGLRDVVRTIEIEGETSMTSPDLWIGTCVFTEIHAHCHKGP